MISEAGRRKAAIVSGVLLLGMTIIAPIAHFKILSNLFVQGDMHQLYLNLFVHRQDVLTASILLFITALFDIIIAVSLYLIFKNNFPQLSQIMGLLRIIYGGAFIIITTHLASVYALLQSNPPDSYTIHEKSGVFLYSLYERFNSSWTVILALFGIHLILLGVLLFRSSSGSRIIGILIIAAGIGYSLDGISKLITPGSSLTISQYTFAGEVFFIFWLLLKGVKGFKEKKAAS
jgi:hypothetical protein